MKRTVALVGWLIIGVACDGSPHRSATPTATRDQATSTTRSHPPPCALATRFGAGGAANEIHGRSSTAQLWGLALGPGHVPPHVGDELKVVWRMTGSGPLRVSVTAPDGQPKPLVFGPEVHSASNYHRPGDEWGTGFRFSASGCWHIHFARTDASADVWLEL